MAYKSLEEIELREMIKVLILVVDFFSKCSPLIARFQMKFSLFQFKNKKTLISECFSIARAGLEP